MRAKEFFYVRKVRRGRREYAMSRHEVVGGIFNDNK
jgi:hypothetical protein